MRHQPARSIASGPFESLELCCASGGESGYTSAAVRSLRSIVLVLGLLAAAAAGPAVAQSYYDVEIIVFEQLSAKAVPSTPTPVVTPVTPAEPPATPDPRFEPLPPDKLQLRPEYQSLRASKSYRPLLHQGWRQQVLGPRNSVARPLLEQTGSGLFSGELKVYMETFLHIDLDLTFDVPGEGGYRLRDSRRVRSRETHYFDNPRFGILIRLTPS
jgi:hypothetical protein